MSGDRDAGAGRAGGAIHDPPTRCRTSTVRRATCTLRGQRRSRDTPAVAPIARDDRVSAARHRGRRHRRRRTCSTTTRTQTAFAELVVTVDPFDGMVNADRTVTLTAEAAARVVTYTVTDRDGSDRIGLHHGARSRKPSPPALVSEAPVEVTSGKTETFDLATYVMTSSGRPAIITEVERVYAAPHKWRLARRRRAHARGTRPPTATWARTRSRSRSPTARPSTTPPASARRSPSAHRAAGRQRAADLPQHDGGRQRGRRARHGRPRETVGRRQRRGRR